MYHSFLLLSVLFNKGKRKPFVRVTHTHSHITHKDIQERAGTGPASPDSLQTGTDSDSHNEQGEEGRHKTQST